MEGACEQCRLVAGQGGPPLAAGDEASRAADDLVLLRLQPDRSDDQPAGAQLPLRPVEFHCRDLARPAGRRGGLGGEQDPSHRRLPRRAPDQADPVQDHLLQPDRDGVAYRRAARSYLDSDGFSVAFHDAIDVFTWRRFAATRIWLFVGFLLYVTATELSAALGPGKLRQLMFGPR
jgi:hypothetical protein